MNKHVRTAVFAATFFISTASGPVQAGLIGQQVAGSLFFQGSSINSYDPANGTVPPGFENSSGTQVIINEPAVEFGSTSRGFFVVTMANFTDTGVTVIASNHDAPRINAFEATFTSPVQFLSGFANIQGLFTGRLDNDNRTLIVDFAGSDIRASG